MINFMINFIFNTPGSAGAKSLLGSTREEEELEAILGSQSQVNNNKRRVVTYGFGGSSDWRAIMLVPNPQGGTDYTVVSSITCGPNLFK